MRHSADHLAARVELDDDDEDRHHVVLPVRPAAGTSITAPHYYDNPEGSGVD